MNSPYTPTYIVLSYARKVLGPEVRSDPGMDSRMNAELWDDILAEKPDFPAQPYLRETAEPLNGKPLQQLPPPMEALDKGCGGTDHVPVGDDHRDQILDQ